MLLDIYIDEKVYEHFLDVSMSILLGEKVDRELVCYAKELLLWFACNSINVYGNTFTVYNVHGLIHLADNVISHGCSLNTISAFKFENYMQSLKKMVRNSNNSIAQVVKRLSEKCCSNYSAKHSTLFKKNGEIHSLYQLMVTCVK